MKLLAYIIGWFSYDEKARFLRILHADEAFNALHSITEYLRREDKYVDQITKEQFKKVGDIREKVREIIYNDNRIDLDGLYF